MQRFELNKLPSYDDHVLLAELRRVSGVVDGSFLTERDFERFSKASSSTIRNRFGGWQRALERAGLGARYSGGIGSRGRKSPTFSDSDLLAELRRVSEHINGGIVTIEVF
jgi:hypothetical protein